MPRTKYSVNEAFDLSDESTSYYQAIDMVGRDKRVLEFGCSIGYVSKVLVQRGCRVVGIELDPEAATEARAYCDRVIVGDLDVLDLAEALSVDDQFDVILFQDVLEHLRDPASALLQARGVLSDEGYAVISFPNVAHGSVRLSLMLGVFEYESLGILDETHLRFFTRDSMKRLLADCGYAVEETRAISRAVDPVLTARVAEHLGMEDRLDRFAKVLAETETDAYQYVMKAVPSDLDEARVARAEAIGASPLRSFPQGKYPGYVCIQGGRLESLETELQERRRWVESLEEGIFYRDNRVRELEEAIVGIQSHPAYRIYRAVKSWLRMGR